MPNFIEIAELENCRNKWGTIGWKEKHGILKSFRLKFPQNLKYFEFQLVAPGILSFVYKRSLMKLKWTEWGRK